MLRLELVSELRETFSVVECNRFLGEGFVLLKILSSKFKEQDLEQVRPVYVLGKSKLEE